MRWLFAAQLRPFVLLAGAASLVLNLALLVPALYMVQVFDRVFASRSVETLVMLTVIAAGALALGYCMDIVRARALAWAGAALDRRLSPLALASVLRQAAGAAGRADTDALRDIAQLRGFLGGTGIQALFDAPWLPIFLLVIALMHPLLGVTAALGAVLLAGLAVLTERSRASSPRTRSSRSRATSRHAEALARNAEVIVGMGMTPAAVGRWQARHDELLDAQARLAARSARLAAAARIARQALQVAMLGGRRVARDRHRRVARHHGRGHHPARPRAAAGRAPDRRLEDAGRRARRVAAAERHGREPPSAEPRSSCRRRRAGSRSSASCSARRRCGPR